MVFAEHTGSDDLIEDALQLLRVHLGVDVVFVAQLVDDERVIRYVDSAPGPSTDADRRDVGCEAACRHIVDGRLPQFQRDAAREAVVRALGATVEEPQGRRLTVPIVFSDGRHYGLLGCFGRDRDAAWDEDALEVARMLAAMVSSHVETSEAGRRRREQRRARLRTLTGAGSLELHLVFQPIVSLAEGRTVGVEALARFPALADEVPRVFADARHLGVGLDLELRAVSAGLQQLPRLRDDVYLALNVGPATVSSSKFLELMRGADPQRVVIEITEHDAVEDYRLLNAAIEELTTLGVRVAIDDVGTGYSGLDHILRLSPDTLKIDGALIEDIDTSPAKQAMISALLGFAASVGTTLIAEHIETAAELETLRSLGVQYGQGYHLGHPSHLPPAETSRGMVRG
jgi:EAL domain-containing protein (putative c-di-GMP-specific phosphodiesterase class I)